MSIYEGFASVYDIMQSDVDYDKWAKALSEISKAHVRQPRTVLELACGTGTLAIELSKQGFICEGVDISEEMLAIANHKAIESVQRIRFLCQDIQAFNTGKKYDVIFSMCDGFNYLTEDGGMVNAFKAVHKHLNDDGIFIFDLSSKYKLSQIIGNNTFAETFEDTSYIWENEFDEIENLLHFTLTLFVKDGELYERFEEYHTQRAYAYGEVLNLILPFFEVLKTVDGDTFEAVTQTSQRLCFICKKIEK